MVTGCDFGDFVVFIQKDLHVQRIPPDFAFMSSMLLVLALFYESHVQPYLEKRADASDGEMIIGKESRFFMHDSTVYSRSSHK